MSIVTVSPKFQVVIPRHIREALGLEPGQKVQAFEYEGRVEFVPVRPAKALRGFLRGLNTTVTRERDRK
ncbi:MAG: AbrB/MazE/SpoVT family DNA-binding domain-containing protein [Gemmatimonadales bacterium]